jgi:Protein of unknown function (DUF3564)
MRLAERIAAHARRGKTFCQERFSMRLTILINGPDPTVNHDYAVLWLDTKEHVWSRESHDGIDLPAWGDMRDEDGVTKLCAPQTSTPVCTLSGLHVDRDERVAAAQGAAQWSCATKPASTGGLWRLQAVEKQTVLPENSVFPN